VRAELGSLSGVEAALEEGAEDGRLDAGPVQGGGARQGRQIVGRERERRRVGEEAAVEVGDVVGAKAAARGHSGEQQAQTRGEVGRPGARALDERGE